MYCEGKKNGTSYTINLVNGYGVYMYVRYKKDRILVLVVNELNIIVSLTIG